MVGIGLEAIFEAGESRLAAPVLRRHMPTFWAGTTGVVRWHQDQMRPAPGQFVIELTPKLVPNLVGNGAIEASFLTDVAVRLLDAAIGRRVSGAGSV
ncbi:hypothetical protein KO116_01492 [Halomonas sp. KO116]|nr:hypothetical protein KO116_01492 [Halomonas sp. KO116]